MTELGNLAALATPATTPQVASVRMYTIPGKTFPPTSQSHVASCRGLWWAAPISSRHRERPLVSKRQPTPPLAAALQLVAF